jgi:hypothetical protein
MGKGAPKAQKEELKRVVELKKARLEAHLATSPSQPTQTTATKGRKRKALKPIDVNRLPPPPARSSSTKTK